MPPPGGSQAKPGAGRHRWPLWAGVGVALAGVGVGGGFIGAATASPGTSAAAPSSASSSCPVTRVADRVVPSVVTIGAKGQSASGTGSGEVIRPDGYILTNNHVIAPAANGGSVQVLFSDGTTATATITGRDPLTDLAVIKVRQNRDLKPIELGSSESLQVGEPVVAVGAPLGLSGTVTSGIVSALDRTVQVAGENDTSALLLSAVQTDAPINPGNSGGALVNCDAKLIGVPSAGASVPSPQGEPANGGASGSIGVGFAIPVNLAKTISSEIIDTGRVTHAYFGLKTLPIPASVAAQAGVPEGLLVAAVASGGPAAQAGLRPEDVITEIAGEKATSNVQLQQIELTKKPGDQVDIAYSRDGKQATATVKLTAQP